MSGICTFLFTDIEGSTRRWEADPEAMRVALAAHDEVLRGTIATHKGLIFKHTGDGVCAVFASPRSAVDAAVAAQRALELPVRMGIATGEAESRGDDYFGTVLNRTARVMAAGHGGQILLDGATASLMTGVDLMALGNKRLRDIAKPVEMLQVQAPGLRSEFPPLKTIDPAPGNLRPRNTTFIGREAELAELGQVLKGHQLVTLSGVGGVGKTRLALEIAARLTDDFLDGVWVIELAAVGDPAAVPEAVAAVLGITQQPQMTIAESVATALEDRSRLLIVDNCEHVLDAAADMIEAILARSATVKVIATSREGLRVADEQLWPVPSLDVRTSAVDLFVERAHGVAPGISLNEDVGAVTEICRRLDGIPLAIELAASRMQSMTAIEVRDRLDDRFRLLVGSRRGLERHQTLRHAVQWSYDLLDDAEKSLLNRCSVFAGGFDLAGAQAITGSDDDFATLDLLDALVRKSLLVADRSAGQTRFSMLETIRQFAEDQLVATGEVHVARAAHAHYFADREADILALWDGPRQRESYRWFTVELANLRAAVRWAADEGDLDNASAIAVYATFLGMWVEQYEPVGWAEDLIEPAQTLKHRRLAQLYVVAAQCFATGRVDDALRYAESGLLAIDSGQFDEVPYLLEASLSGPYIAKGDPEKWVALCRSMLERWPNAHTYALARLVMALTVAGHVEEAMEISDGLIAERADNPHVAALAFLAYGYARRDTDPVAAFGALRQGLIIARESGNRQMESNVAVSLSRLAANGGNHMEVFDNLVPAIRTHHDSGSFSLLPQPLAVLATALDQLGRYEPAATISRFAATAFTKRAFPEIGSTIDHLREVLGDEAYEALASTGASMTNAAMTAYALEQIDGVRAELLHEDDAP